MLITLDTYQLQQMLNTAAELGASNVLVELGLNKTKITKAEAYRRYTRRLIDKWVRECKVTPVKIEGTTLLDVKELELVSKVNDLYKKHLKS